MKQVLIVSFSLAILVNFISCEEKTSSKKAFDSKEEFEETLILSHQEFLKNEKTKIEKFIDSTSYEFKKTGTGLRICVTDSTNGERAKTGDLVLISYQLNSIEGDSLYASPKGKFQEFAVDYDAVESGLHEGIKLMKTGESAIMILPAHLGHGITGDQAAISSQTTLVYSIYLAGKR